LSILAITGLKSLGSIISLGIHGYSPSRAAFDSNTGIAYPPPVLSTETLGRGPDHGSNHAARPLVFDKDDNAVIVTAHTAESADEATFVWIDNKNCIRCGKCLRVCPTRAISMRKTKIVDCPVPAA
jgi:NAD-dependent dihydropyrimidine dehydrogenase PreA subunit